MHRTKLFSLRAALTVSISAVFALPVAAQQMSVMNPPETLAGHQTAWTIPGDKDGSLFGVTASTVIMKTKDDTFSGYSYNGQQKWRRSFPGPETIKNAKQVNAHGMILLGNLLVSAWTEKGDGPGTVEVDAYSADTGKPANPPIVYKDRRGVVPELWGHGVMDLYDNESMTMREFFVVGGKLASRPLTAALAANPDALRRQGWTITDEDALDSTGEKTDGAVQLTEDKAVRIFSSGGAEYARIVNLKTRKSVGGAIKCGTGNLAFAHARFSPNGHWALLGSSLLVKVGSNELYCVDGALKAAQASAAGGLALGDRGGIYITAGQDSVAYLAPGASKADVTGGNPAMPVALLPKKVLFTVGAIQDFRPGTLVAIER